MRAIKWSFMTIGAYLAVAYATGFGHLIDVGSKGGVGLVKAFQGR